MTTSKRLSATMTLRTLSPGALALCQGGAGQTATEKPSTTTSSSGGTLSGGSSSGNGAGKTSSGGGVLDSANT